MQAKSKDYWRIVEDYVTNMAPVLDERALYSDETEFYRSPYEPKPGERVTVRFRTRANNVDAVYMLIGDDRLQMHLAQTRRDFDYYEAQIDLGSEIVYYLFEVISGNVRCYFSKVGATRDMLLQYHFGIVPGFSTPEWAKGAVMYQIFVSRFRNGDPDNDVVDNEYYYIGDRSRQVKEWNKPPANMGVREFYGGDLQGIIDKLDYLQDLGVEVLYLNPIFVSPSNHKYDIQDYDYVDPHYGKIVNDGGRVLEPWDCNNAHASKYIRRVTDRANLEASNQLFVELVEKLHARGMKIILDGVFNHCGSFNKWLDRERIYELQEGYEKGAYITEDSPYHSFFKFLSNKDWPYNGMYDGWWGHDTLPKLNYEESPILHDYIMEIAKKWVSPPFCVDGWRLDVAADLGHSNEYNHRFWRDFRNAVKEANPQAVILAEHYGDPSGWLKGNEWDSVMNYDAFMEPITWFLTGMEKHSDEYRQDLYGNSEAFIGSMQHHMSKMFRPSLEMAMNELSNHDHSRFLTRTNHKVGRVEQLGNAAADEGVNKAVLREAVVMQMTWVGAPTIYYGDEAGVCGFTDPDNRRTYPWGMEDHELIDFHRDIIRIHKRYRTLINGSTKHLCGGYQWVCYGRFSDDDQIVVAVNNQDEELQVEIPVYELGFSAFSQIHMQRLIQTDADGYTTAPASFPVNDGMLSVKLPCYGAVVFYRQERDDEYGL